MKMKCLGLFLAALSLSWGLGDGQVAPNITLSLFEISPCGSTTLQTVSRFKQDVYAVQANLSDCARKMGASFNDSIKIVSSMCVLISLPPLPVAQAS